MLHTSTLLPALIKIVAWTALSSLVASTSAYANCENTDIKPGLQQLFSKSWGTEYSGERFQSSANTSINADNASTLSLKWAYGLSTDQPRSYPLVTEDTLFIGDGGRGLVALDKETGCVRWENNSIKDISTSIISEQVDGRTLLIFSGRRSGVHAVDASTGDNVWSSVPKVHPVPLFSGSPLAYKDTIFVPISSLEIGLSANPFYGCCTTSGGMAALDIRTGELLWYRPTIEKAGSVITGKHYLFVEKRGPSGAPVWGAPMLDTQRDLLFFGSGQNYSLPASLTSDAIFAVHTKTGEIAWVKQFTADDTFNMACTISIDHPNCPSTMGPDVDFGAPPLLTQRLSGQDILIAGQKSGDVYGINPDTGQTIWSTRFGRGGPLGGVHWGIAANPELGLAFIPISDVPGFPSDAPPAPGLYAIDVKDGSLRWSVEREASCQERSCWTGLSAAITAGPNIVVAGAMDGMLEIYRADNGEKLWSYDTKTEYDAVNGLPTKGGTLDAHGPMLAGDLLIVSSGYGSFQQEEGNALLVFSTAQEQTP